MPLKELLDDEHFQEWAQSDYMTLVIKDIRESQEHTLLKAMVTMGETRDKLCDQAGGMSVVVDMLVQLQEATKPEQEEEQTG